MHRAEKDVKYSVQEGNITVQLVVFRESVFLDGDRKGIEIIFNDTEIVFTPSELEKLTRHELVNDGVGGTCDWCGSDCEESVFLDMEFSFITLHPACYTYVQRICSEIYSKYKSDILGFSL